MYGPADGDGRRASARATAPYGKTIMKLPKGTALETAAGSWLLRMRSIELLVIAMLVSCSSAKPPLAPVVIPEATAACADLACIEANVGKVIDLEGTFAFPMDQKRKGKHHYRLNVADGTSVILYDKALRDKLTKERDGEHMTVRGIVYTTEIPDEYGIIARTADPYCVRLYDVR